MRFLDTLNARLLASYVLVVALSLLAAAVALGILLQGYQNRLTLNRLADVAVPIAAQVRTMVLLRETPQDLVLRLSEQAKQLDVRVLLLNRQGRVLYDTSSDGDLRGQVFDAPLPPATDPLLAQADRWVPPNGRALLYVALPVETLVSRLQGTNLSYLVLAQPEQSGVVLGQLASRLLFAGAVAVVAATIVALLVANSFYRPIRRLTDASERMARGDYDQRVPVAGPTELRELALSFNQMASEVQRSRAVLRDFVADVSHELRTPLTSIRGFAQALGDGTIVDEEERKRALAVVDDEARRLHGLVTRLLDLSRMESGQVAMARGPVPLAELARYVLDVFERRAEEKGVRLRSEVAEGLVVAGDEDRLEQLVTNLVDNAIRYTPAGGEVVVSASRSSGGRIEVAVRDTGRGIPPDQLPRIFERFHTANGGEGTGLGLAIARQIARAHGGDLTATSTPGAGSTFTATLPAWDGEG